MSSSNRMRVAYEIETAWGELNGAPDMNEARLTSESLNFDIENTTSEELRSDRNTTDLVQTSRSASGGIDLELSYETYDDFLLSALHTAAWSTPVAVSDNDIAATATSFTTAGGDFTAENIDVGQFIKVDGFTNSAINTIYRVTSVATGEIEVSPVPAATEVLGNTITMTGSYIRNGVAQVSNTIEKGALDADGGNGEYFLYTGMIVNEFSLNVEAQSIVTGSFAFLGKNGTLSGTERDAPTAANTNDVMNAVANVGSIREGDVEVSAPNYIQSLSLTLNNNLTQNYAVGSDFATEIISGSVDLTGDMSTYFGDSTLVDKYISGAETSVDFQISDAAGNIYLFDIPAIKFSTGEVVAGGKDQNVMADMSWQAIMDGTYGYTFQICKF